MCSRSLTLTPGFVISIHTFLPLHTHVLPVQVRGLFTCSTASTVSILSIWNTGREGRGNLKLEEQSTALGEYTLNFGREWPSGR